MKKTAIALVASAAAMFAASCQKETSPIQEEFVPMTISAVAEGLNTPVKSAIEFKYDVTWTANDKIYVTDGNDKNDTFTIISESVGKTLGKFTQDGQTAFVSQETPSCDVEAYYPSSMMDGTTPTWPASQTYSLENAQTVPMYSKKTITATGDQTFSFASLGSVLQIVFTTSVENITLKSIEVKDGSKTLSGAFHVDDNGMAIIDATDKAGITLDLGDGVPVGFVAKYFNIAVPTNDYTDLAIVFTATDGSKCTLEHGSVNISYNTVGRLTLTGKAFKGGIPKGALSGEFTVGIGADNTAGTEDDVIVHFSQGNLWYGKVGSATTATFNFEANQYDFRTYEGNGSCIDGTYSTTSGTPTGHWGLFCWSTDATSNNWGIHTNTAKAQDYIAGSFKDWGKNIGDGNTWRTLTKDEWVYLFNTRTMASGGARYERLTSSGITVEKVTFKGVVLFPDNFTEQNTWKTIYTTWEALKTAGLVFLPAAGSRSGSIVSNVGDFGGYWSSTDCTNDYAYNVYLNAGGVDPAQHPNRYVGYSVRLVTDVE